MAEQTESVEIAPYVENEAEFLADALALYDFDIQCDSEDREAAEDDNRFANASDDDTAQWDKVALAMRTVPGSERPIQQWNRLPTYIQQVSNDGRQNKPAIKVSPADGGTRETADYFQDRIRHIEYDSNADIAYDTARDQQITSGRGFIRVDTELIPGTFKQRICITPIDNQFSVVFDAAAMRYDLSDADHCFVISRISQAKHIRDYGKESIVSQMDFTIDPNPAPKWIGVGDKNDLVQIAEYWVKEYRKRRLCLLPGDIPVWKDTLSADQYDTFKRNGQILSERDDQDYKIIQYVINGAEVLDKREWIGTTIPIVPLWGRIAVVGGRRRTFSLIRNAKDPQRLVNLYVSNIAEQIAQMPKTPYIAAVGSIAANHEADWQNAANSPLGFLLWTQFGPDGKQYERPQRVINEPPIQALTIGLQQAIEGIKSAMGIYDASLGARSNETSGVAIDQRRKSADVLNLHFSDNEARSRKRVGEIVIELIPILDKPGTQQPVRERNGKARNVPIGQEHVDPKTGNVVTHVLTEGDYGVSVSTGPTFESARKELYQRDADLIKYDPELIWVIGDQMFEADDSPGAEERAARMKRAIQLKTPGLIQEPQQAQPIPPVVQQQIQQLQQKLQTTQAFAQSLHEQIATKQPELQNNLAIKQMEIEAKGAEAVSNNELERWKVSEQELTKRTIGLAQIDQKDAIAYLTQEIGALNQRHQQLHDRMMQDQAHSQALARDKQQQDSQMAQQQDAHDSQTEQQESDQQHEAEMQGADHQNQQDLQESSQGPDPQAGSDGASE